jgi:hypothetical protein
MFPYICKEHYGVNGIDQRHKTVTTEPIITKTTKCKCTLPASPHEIVAMSYRMISQGKIKLEKKKRQRLDYLIFVYLITDRKKMG